jgi:hypothetical protein
MGWTILWKRIPEHAVGVPQHTTSGSNPEGAIGSEHYRARDIVSDSVALGKPANQFAVMKAKEAGSTGSHP